MKSANTEKERNGLAKEETKKVKFKQNFYFSVLQKNALKATTVIYYFSIWGNKLGNNSNFFSFP